MGIGNHLKLNIVWHQCLVISFMYLLAGTSSACVREGDCAVLRCPPARCNMSPGGHLPVNDKGCLVIKSNEELGPPYIIRWTHLEDNYTSIRKEFINEGIRIKGNFKGKTELLENGDLKILKADRTFIGSYSCDVYYQSPVNAKSTKNSFPIRLVVLSESDPSPVCEPVNECDKEEGGLSKKVSMGLIIVGGIFGAIFLIFAGLCIRSYRNKHKPATEMINQQKSVIYNLSSSAPSSSRMSTSSFTPPFYIVSSEFDNNSEIYDEIQDSNVKVKADDKAENAYMGLEVPGTDRQDSGIEVDNNSTKSKQEHPTQKNLALGNDKTDSEKIVT